MSVPPPISLHHISPFSHTQKRLSSSKKIKTQISTKDTLTKMHLQQSPAFGNASGISSSSPHFPKKMNLNNDNNIVLPRIKNNSTTTTQACAACKYQRRKCEPNCILSPYFPHNRQAQFLNAHKLFGVSNITKIIRDLSPADKDQAMKTIIFQSDVRANDPVGGCYRIIKELQFMIEYYQAELDLVMHQLSIFREQHHAQTTTQEQQGGNGPQHPQFVPFMTSDQAAKNDCSGPNSDVINADPVSAYSPSSLQCSYQHHHQQQQEQLNLQLGGITDHRDGEEDNFILVNDENNRYEGSVQQNAAINNTWVRQEKDEQEQERMVNYCLNENEEDQCISKDSFDDHKKDMSSSLERSCNKLKFDVEEDHEGGSSSSNDWTILNDTKNLCTLEANGNGLVQHEGYGKEEGSDTWFRLTKSKRKKTTV